MTSTTEAHVCSLLDRRFFGVTGCTARRHGPRSRTADVRRAPIQPTLLVECPIAAGRGTGGAYRAGGLGPVWVKTGSTPSKNTSARTLALPRTPAFRRHPLLRAAKLRTTGFWSDRSPD